jgi:hypothetical protein
MIASASFKTSEAMEKQVDWLRFQMKWVAKVVRNSLPD